MHAEIDCHQPRAAQDVRVELLERQVESAHRKAGALEQRRRLGQSERLSPQLVGVDQDDWEGSGYFDLGRCA
jgi:hypothetical protein